MKRLLWKEFRERCWWALGWTAAIVGASCFGQAQAFCGDQAPVLSVWLVLPLLMAALVGAGAFAGETTRDRATFVYSRPIPWWAMLVAKFIFGAVIMVGAPLLAALLFRCFAPEPYRLLATPAHLLVGVWGLAWKLAVLYLFGLACSVVIPGIAGGVLTVVVVIVFALPIAVLIGLFSFAKFWQIQQAVGLCLAAWIGTVCAGLLLTRYGLTLSTDERVKRFAQVFVPVLLGGWLLSVALPQAWGQELLLRWEPSFTSVSPTGAYALLVSYQRFNPLGLFLSQNGDDFFASRSELVRMADGALVMTIPTDMERNYNSLWSWQWTSNDLAYYVCYDGYLYIVNTPARKLTRLPTQNGRPWLTSPDGNLLLFREIFQKDNHSPTETRLRFIDLRAARMFNTSIKGSIADAWWQSNTEVGYHDYQHERHVVPLGVLAK